jgi:hypothetical protein
MPAFSNTRSSGPAVAVKGSLRRASPALDRAHRTLSVNPAHSNFKRGGFVLLTPDDEGRLFKFGEPMRQRARQNVIFEGGYLTALFRRKNRICFLQKGDVEVPSDLNGLLMERFPERIDAGRILLTLGEWGLGSTPSDADSYAGHEKVQALQSAGVTH